MSVASLFAPWTANGADDETVGRWIDHLLARVVHFLHVGISDVKVDGRDERQIEAVHFVLVVDGAIGSEESAVVRIARHGTKDDAQVASTARTPAHHVE